LAQHYAPEEVSGAVLATQLAEELAAKGMDVTFLTTAPNYPYGKVFAGFHNSLYKVEWQNDVRIIRTWSYISPSKSLFKRIMNQITFSISCFFVGLVNRKFDILFSYSPPLPLGISALLLSCLKRIPWILRVEDLFPDTAITGGVLHNKTAIRILYWVERRIYKKATHISLISDTFKDILIAKNIDTNKLSVTPVWADPKEILPCEKDNSFRKQHGVNGKFLILYTGNIGFTSALEDILSVAENLKNNPDFIFFIIGEGIKKNQLELIAKEKELKNVRFLPYQKRVEVQNMLAAADLCLVTINRNASNFSLPSKLFTYMASARPILAISPRNSEVAKLIQETKCGINVENEDLQAILTVIERFYLNPELGVELGDNGRYVVENKFSRNICIEQFRKIIIKNVN